MSESPREPAANDESVIERSWQQLLYTLSLPERAVRSGSGLLGGMIKHSASVLVPRAFQSSKTYTVFIQQTLDFLVQDVGGVECKDAGTAGTSQVENYVARKAVGNFIELAGLATLHLSPITVLAIVSDLAYGSQAYLHELSAELKRQGIIDSETTIDHVGDLLDAVSNASGVAASAFDTPPLSVEGLRETIDQTRSAVERVDTAKLLPRAEIDWLWHEMQELATREGVGVFELSSAVALGTLEKVGHLGLGALSGVRVAGNLVDRHLIEHYAESLDEIRRRGFYATLAETSEPYIEAVWKNFSTEQTTLTEDLFTGKLLSRWFGSSPPNTDGP